jgi:hypothetical protein
MSFFSITNVFIIPVLSIFGFITNVLSITVFISIIKNEQRSNSDDMYKYLLLKSICEIVGCFFSLFYSLYFGNYNLRHTFILTIWFVWFKEYINYALFMASTGFEIAATFNCAISIEKRMKWCEKRLSFWLWVISILILSFGVEMFPVLMYTIYDYKVIDKNNRTIHRFEAYSNDLIFKYDTFGLAESIIKDVIFLLILLCLNSYILFKLIQIGRRKKRLTSNSSQIQNNHSAEKRKIIMIMVLFLTFLFGHLPNFVMFTLRDYFGSLLFWTNFSYYGTMFSHLRFSTSFFVYFAFNNIFKRLFLKLIHFRSFN